MCVFFSDQGRNENKKGKESSTVDSAYIDIGCIDTFMEQVRLVIGHVLHVPEDLVTVKFMYVYVVNVSTFKRSLP